ncbi:MAG: glycosyltransferase family 4 protein [Psychroflexus sp.]|nr:glycosyltransferase family 4 protein [Psychroflexus sp.]MDN6309526.1 glycosyltransferase family 4 protein [Psychroflexus sp.]
MKVLHVTGAKIWGGNEQQLFNLVTNLKKNGLQNYIFGVQGSKIKKAFDQHDISFECATNEKLKSLKNTTSFQNYIKHINPDVIHLHTSDALTLAYYTSFFYRFNARIVFEKKGIGRSSSFLSRLKYNFSQLDQIICVSDYVKAEFKKMLSVKNQAKLCVIHDSFNTDFGNFPRDFKPPFDTSIFTVGNIANHSSAKDLDTLISVADLLVNQQEIKGIQFVQLGGFSKLTPAYQERIKALELEAYFHFIGQYDQAYLLYQYFDIFLLTSEREGGPTSLLEAFYFKTKVVSTRVGISEILIKNGENGYLADVKAIDKLASSVLEIYKNSTLFDPVLESNKEFILQHFTSERQANEVIGIYRSLL